jgi:hypothetical protein
MKVTKKIKPNIFLMLYPFYGSYTKIFTIF